MKSTATRISILAVGSLLTAAALLAVANNSSSPDSPKSLELSLGKTINLRLPETKTDLKPVSFKTPDGKTGWILQLPGRQAIATPAYTNGKLLVSGGFSSHEVYAFDAKTGETRWTHHTTDNGPTAIVTEDDYGAYSTESCDLEVVNTNTGKIVWQQFLAGTLLTQPAIDDGKLYVAFPGGGSRVPVPAPPPLANAPAPSVTGRAPNGALLNGYRILCADLKTGRKIWEQDLTGEVITAPIIDNGNVYATCMDGTTYCMTGGKGCVTWKIQLPATSAPTIGGGHVMTTQKRVSDGRIQEGLVRLDADGGDVKDKEPLGMRQSKRFIVRRDDPETPADPNDRAARRLDLSARANLNLVSATDGWTYQGPRAVFSHGAFINAQENLVNSLDAATGKLRWQATISGPALDSPAESFMAPVLGKQNIYLLSNSGYIISLNHDTAQVNFSYKVTNIPFCLQPCLAEGNIYAGTTDGRLLCIPADKDADGWYAWGGNAQHNQSR